MKKIFIVFATALLIGCGGKNDNDWASGPGTESELEDRAPVDPADTSSVHSDTTTSGGMNRQNQYDTIGSKKNEQ